MKFLIDETHNPRGRVFSNYTEFRRLLELNNHEIDLYDDFPIKYETISDADVFILPCCDGSKLYEYEVKALWRYVEEGHGLFIISHAGGDGGLGTNMNSLTAPYFDITIQSNQVFDEFHNHQEISKQIVISDFHPHPIIQELEQICYVAGCSLKIGQQAQSLITSDTDADPSNAALVAIWDGGNKNKGNVAVSGSYRMFSDYGIGLKQYQNAQFTLNLCKWLAKDLKTYDNLAQDVISKTKASVHKYSQQIYPTSSEPISSNQEKQISPIKSSVSTFSEPKSPKTNSQQIDEFIKQPISNNPEFDTSSTITINLPILDSLLAEMKLLRMEHNRSMKEIKELLQFLKEKFHQ